jgi:hypothetical protein
MSVFAAIVWVVAVAQDDPAGRLDELVRQLGADDFAVREKASEELRKIGKPAEEALRQAAESNKDPEVRERARALLEAMAPKPRTPAQPRGGPGFNFGFGGGRGGSVTVQTVNGDSTYRIAPGDGSPAILFFKSAGGAVRLEYPDEKGESQRVEAESIEKFLKDHAALAEKYGITEEGIAYGGARVGFNGRLQGLPVPRVLNRPRVLVPPLPGLEREELQAGGATFERVDDALRAQLEIPDGQGLVVTRVPDGSAAEAAGLRKSDILLEVDGKRVSSIQDVKEGLPKKTTAVVLRKGRRETLEASGPRKNY